MALGRVLFLCVFPHVHLPAVCGAQGPEHMYLHMEVLGESMVVLVPMGRVPSLTICKKFIEIRGDVQPEPSPLSSGVWL